LIGRGWIFDLSDKRASAAITEPDLEARDPGFLPGDLAVLRTDWTDKHWTPPHALLPTKAGLGHDVFLNIEYVKGLGRLNLPRRRLSPSPSNSSGSMHRPPA